MSVIRILTAVLALICGVSAGALWEISAYAGEDSAICCGSNNDCGDGRVCCPATCLGAYDCDPANDREGYCRVDTGCCSNWAGNQTEVTHECISFGADCEDDRKH